jgi:hypothetical protein
MWLFNQGSTAARTALIYITAGALVVIWTVVWYIYLHNNPPETNSVYYWCTGFLMTGLAFVLIGFGLGRIGRAARHADVPPEGVTLAVMNPQPNAAAPAPVPVAANPTTAVVAPGGPALVPLVNGSAPMPTTAGTLPRRLT